MQVNQMEKKVEDQEIWRPIRGYEKYYIISSHGRIISFSKSRGFGKILEPYTGEPYKRVTLCNNKKCRRFTLHFLVLNNFYKSRPSNYQINHKDGNKFNNKLNNLEYVTAKQNHAHATKYGLKARGEKNFFAILKEKQVIDIRIEYMKRKTSFRDLAKKYKVGVTTIQDIINKVSWRHI